MKIEIDADIAFWVPIWFLVFSTLCWLIYCFSCAHGAFK